MDMFYSFYLSGIRANFALISFHSPIHLPTSPLKVEEFRKVLTEFPPFQGEGWGGDGVRKFPQ